MGKTKKLPPNTDVETTVVIKNKGTRKRVRIIKIGNSKESTDEYYKKHGIISREPDKDAWTDFLNELPERAKNIHDVLNYKKKDYENDIYSQAIASTKEEDFNIVFGKFREFLDVHKNDPKIQHMNNLNNFEIDENKPNADEGLLRLLNDYFDKIIEFITDPNSTYNDALSTISDDIDYWTGGELAILQNPVNKENALFVIGQVFGFIDPNFNDNFVSGELLEKDEIKTKINNKLNADKDTIINFITTQKNTYTKKNALSAFTGSLINPFTI